MLWNHLRSDHWLVCLQNGLKRPVAERLKKNIEGLHKQSVVAGFHRKDIIISTETARTFDQKELSDASTI